MNRVIARRLVDIQLTDAPATWSVPGGEHARITFWWGDVPLGHAVLDRETLPLGGAAVGTIAAVICANAAGQWVATEIFGVDPRWRASVTKDGTPLRLPDASHIAASLSDALQLRPVNGDKLSVVICTRDRPMELARCLASIAASTVLPGEVIVVDNAPSNSRTRETVASFPWAKYVVESRSGLSHARNAGIAAATGALVAFTDDDVEVTPTWIARVVDTFSDPDCDAMTGLVVPAVLATESQITFEEAFGGFSQGYRPLRFNNEFYRATLGIGVPAWSIGAGANMAFRRESFARVGGFDVRLGAGASGCSEDSEWWYRLLASSGTVLYDPRAVVRHHHRAEWDALRAQMVAYMRGHVAALAIQWRRHGHAGNARRALVTIPVYLATVALRRAIFGADRPRSTWSDEALGTLRGLWLGFKIVLAPTPPVWVPPGKGPSR